CATGADLKGGGVLGAVCDDVGAGLAEGRWLVAAADVSVDLEIRGIVAQSDFRGDVIVGAVVAAVRGCGAEDALGFPAVVGGGKSEHAGEAASEGELAFEEAFQVFRGLLVFLDEGSAFAGDVREV